MAGTDRIPLQDPGNNSRYLDADNVGTAPDGLAVDIERVKPIGTVGPLQQTPAGALQVDASATSQPITVPQYMIYLLEQAVLLLQDIRDGTTNAKL